MKPTLESRIADWFDMTDEVWMRHANPWSVYTRMTVLPLLILAVWSRVWIGWWALLPVAAAIAWAWYNPRVFTPVRSTENWASMGVFGERVWLNRRNIPVPAHHRVMPHILSGVSVAGLPFLVWGLWRLEPWPTLFGLTVMLGAKIWFVDRMVCLYAEMQDRDPIYASWTRPQLNRESGDARNV
ncbi:MAG: hypothetical protein QNJ92_14395 [Alphaproteobacteria bacterium]|nr:hypothetical protein [Alphaproteobacteria bacterium]